MSFLIDPTNVINYDRTTGELETWWLFSLCVAGKTATTQARLLDAFLSRLPAARPDSAFARLREAEARGELYQALIDSRLGQYNRLHRAMVESLSLDLRTVSVDELETIHGVGPKTARMFVMMSRRDQRHAALDTHLLKHLNAKGITAPKSTPPSGKKYRELEEAFLQLVDSSGMTVADYDLSVWKLYSHGIAFSG